jgi:hypothetical protein
MPQKNRRRILPKHSNFLFGMEANYRASLKTTHIKRKWKFIAELCEVIDSGAAKW